MRDLTKSVTSYTWAMSVFWTQQMFNFFRLSGSGSWDRSTRAFTNVTEATTNEMGDTMRAVFRGGDSLQRGMVDLLMAPLAAGNWCGGTRDRPRSDAGNDRGGRYSDEARRGDWTPNGSGAAWSDRARGPASPDPATRFAGAAADVMQSGLDTTARAVRRVAEEVASQPSAPAASDPSLGWGPMPR